MKEIITPAGTNPNLPFSAGVKVGNLLFSSGYAGLDASGNVPGPDIESQARQCFDSLGQVLAAAGSDWSKVVKVTCFLTHPERDLAGWNKVFVEHFPTNPPARSTVGCRLLNPAWLIEIELIAVVD
jgi:2-iminobutanoate/2-iminopropanoate deaminase